MINNITKGCTAEILGNLAMILGQFEGFLKGFLEKKISYNVKTGIRYLNQVNSETDLKMGITDQYAYHYYHFNIQGRLAFQTELVFRLFTQY